MKTSKEYIDETLVYFSQRFGYADLIAKQEPNVNAAWQLVFQIETSKIYISSARGYLDFQIVDNMGRNIGIQSKNKEIFHDDFQTNTENIHQIIDFLYEHRDEILKNNY